jgi:hypothetical protein
MPLIKSDTEAATRDNFHEFRHGKTFKRTAKKFGRKRAQKQMVAVILKNKRQSKKARRKRT